MDWIDYIFSESKSYTFGSLVMEFSLILPYLKIHDHRIKNKVTVNLFIYEIKVKGGKNKINYLNSNDQVDVYYFQKVEYKDTSTITAILAKDLFDLYFKVNTFNINNQYYTICDKIIENIKKISYDISNKLEEKYLIEKYKKTFKKNINNVIIAIRYYYYNEKKHEVFVYLGRREYFDFPIKALMYTDIDHIKQYLLLHDIDFKE